MFGPPFAARGQSEWTQLTRVSHTHPLPTLHSVTSLFKLKMGCGGSIYRITDLQKLANAVQSRALLPHSPQHD